MLPVNENKGDFHLASGEVKIVDFGCDGVGGYASFTVVAFSGKPHLRLSYATHPDGLGEKGDFWRETRATYLGDSVDLPILPASVDRFDIFEINHAGEYRASLQQGLLRYARIAIEGENNGAEVEISDFRFDNKGTHSEEKTNGSFKCSDEVLNGIWSASVRTCQLAAIPERKEPLEFEYDGKQITLGPAYAYLSDGAKRDRLVWSGDLWWADLNMYYAFGPGSPYMPGSIRMLAENQTPEGYVQACPYPESHGPLKTGEYGPFQSDEFAAWLVPVVYNYWLYTGDEKLVTDILPVLEKLMAYLESHCRDDGIFEQRMETSKNAGELRFGDTSVNHRAYMNVLLAGCFDAMSKLSGKTGHYAAKAKKLRAQIEELFALEGGGLAKSLEDSALSPEATALWHALPGCAAVKYPRAKYGCIWHAKFQALAIRALFESGYTEEAVKAIYEHNWPKILDPGWKGLRTTYECMHMNTKGWGDESHPDTAIAGLLSRYILGIAPEAPGYSEFSFRPGRTESISSANGNVPTPFGMISASWTYSNGSWNIGISVPAGTNGMLYVDGHDPVKLEGNSALNLVL